MQTTPVARANGSIDFFRPRAGRTVMGVGSGRLGMGGEGCWSQTVGPLALAGRWSNTLFRASPSGLRCVLWRGSGRAESSWGEGATAVEVPWPSGVRDEAPRRAWSASSPPPSRGLVRSMINDFVRRCFRRIRESRPRFRARSN